MQLKLKPEHLIVSLYPIIGYNLTMADEQLDSLKLPPHSIEAEQSVIGGLLLENEALDKVADILTAEDFY